MNLERPAASPARPCLLVADDCKETRWMIANEFSRDGYDIVEATCGRQFFWHMEHLVHAVGEARHLALVDVRLPVYGGLDVLEAWAEQITNLPVILMSSFPEQGVRTRAARLGVPFVEKPLSMRAMRQLADLTLAAWNEAPKERGYREFVH